MGDPFDHEFAKTLQQADRKVCLDWEEMKPALRYKLRHRARQKARLLMVGGMVTAFLVGCFLYQVQKDIHGQPGLQIQHVVQSENPKHKSDLVERKSDSLLEVNKLAELRQQLENVKQELKRLDEIQAAQRLAILKEVVSRTEFEQQAIAVYHF